MYETVRQTFESLVTFIHQFTNIVSKGDPVVNGLATMTALSFSLYLFRKLPPTVGRVLLNRITFQYTLSMNHTYGADKLYFEHLAEAVRRHNTKRRVFSLSFLGNDKGRDLAITSGKGTGYFFLKGGIVFFTRSETVTKDLVELSFSFRTFLVSQQDFKEFVDVSPYRGKSMSYVPSMYASEEPLAVAPINNEVTFNINPKVKAQIDEALKKQVSEKQHFKSRAVCNKLNFLFYGPPGTGKSSLSLYIASKTNKSMFFSDTIAGLWSPAIEVFLSRVKPVIVMDDLERDQSLQIREGGEINSSDIDIRRGLLNFLDGVRTPEDRIVVITVNDLNKLPSVFYRSNRIDVMIEVGYERKEDFARCLHYYFPEANPAKYHIPENIIFSSAICANMFKRHSQDPDLWVEALKEEALKLQESLMEPTAESRPVKLSAVA